MEAFFTNLQNCHAIPLRGENIYFPSAVYTNNCKSTAIAIQQVAKTSQDAAFFFSCTRSISQYAAG